MLESLKNAGIKNIAIFISDATRFDHLPKEVREMGVTFKMVSSSTFTAPSVSSLITGLFPFRHTVFSFHDSIPPQCMNLLKLPGYNCSFWTENTWIDMNDYRTSPIYKMMRMDKRISLKEIEEPFIYIEDEKGGHCPYGWDYDDEDYEEWDCQKFYSDYGRKELKELRKKYQDGMDRSLREFNKRINILKERGILEETLVIFIADHGELLGEYGGIIAHATITTPEIIYVPCVFIHPSLENGISFEGEGVISHVDLLPTIIELLHVNNDQKFDGESLFKMKNVPKYKYSYFQLKVKKAGLFSMDFDMIERGLWSSESGIVFRDCQGFLKLSLRALHELYFSKNVQSYFSRSRLIGHPINSIRDFYQIFNIFTKKEIKFGHISMEKEKILELIELLELKKIQYNEKMLLSNKIKSLKLKV